ncbi:MAG: tetratricopeptide repeat protein, partial [Verrucomicrobiota bacterium]
NRGATKPGCLFRENPPGGGPFGCGLRGLGRHSPLRGCSIGQSGSDLAALATTKIPRRRTPRNFKTGSYTNPTEDGVIEGKENNRPNMKKEPAQPESALQKKSNRSSLWLWLMTGCALVVLLGMFRSLHDDDSPSALGPANTTGSTSDAGVAPGTGRARRFAHNSSSAPAPAAEEIVAHKVSQFAGNRRELARAIGRRSQKEVPPEVEKFFAAIESGRWEEIEAQWKALASRSGQYEHSTNHWAELDLFWPAVLDAYGVAEQAHLWPAQQLLDYGNAILDSLRPGMVYVGGTDNGRWIPELLNETSGGEPHIIVTQNAFADARYLDFVNTLYSDRMATLTTEESQGAFQQYVADAQKRLEHDEQFPDEPKQVRPGEDVRVIDGKVQVGGQAAVMAINEKLLQTLMQKNPDLSFALQESFPFKGTYSDALPLGPLMELGAKDGQDSFTAERAAQSVDYWRKTAQQIFSDPEAVGSLETLKSYSHDAVAAANLLGAHNFTAEAEQAYRLAAQLWPENPESVGGLGDLLARSGRESEARQLLDEFVRQHPGQRKDLERISAAIQVIGPAQPTRP